MGTILRILILCATILTPALGQTQQIVLSKNFAVSAIKQVFHDAIEGPCISSNIGGSTNWQQYSSGRSIENLIDLIERFEIMLINGSDPGLSQLTTSADVVARLFLRRFRFDGYDPDENPDNQRKQDKDVAEMANIFLSETDTAINNNYYFPDRFYTQEELCTLYLMLSHNLVDSTNPPIPRSMRSPMRGKRQVYSQYNKQQQQQRPINNRQFAPNNNNPGVASNFLAKDRVSPYVATNYQFKEDGVVSFRSSQNEAIAPARVLVGVVAGLSQRQTMSVKEVLDQLGFRGSEPGWATGSLSNPIDVVTATTIGDLWGSATELPNNKDYIFGITGKWSLTSCTNDYGLPDIKAADFVQARKVSKATLAEIRGGIDGYMIGKYLSTLNNPAQSNLRLSAILRSFYSKPFVTTVSRFTTFGYCSRTTPNSNQDLTPSATGYAIARAVKNGYSQPNLANEFTQSLSTAAQSVRDDGLSEYCNAQVGAQDKNAPCETPSDVIFVVDGGDRSKLQKSADIVARILGNMHNFRSNGGAISIFLNSQNKSPNPGVTLAGDWPLGAAAFNSTDAGYAQCRINDYNTTQVQPVANTGKLFKYLNQTLMNLEYWTPRANSSAIPAKSAVLIDLSTVVVAPDSGQDKDDYNEFKDKLRYRHRDVRFLSVADSADLFKDILRDDTDKESPASLSQLGGNLAKKICENPATFQYNLCDDKRSDGVNYIGYITPGYKQNWAMYPEFFHRSFTIKFYFKAEDGNIRVCYDRKFPPEDVNNCKDLKQGEEDYYKINNPCKGESVSSCDPFYFTVWGKDKPQQSQCTDDRCLNLEQIKFTVTHTGVQCSSSNHLLPSMSFQIISLTIFAILYLFFNNN